MNDIKLYWIPRQNKVRIPIKYLRFTDDGMPSIIQPCSDDVFGLETASDLLSRAFIDNPSEDFTLEAQGSDRYDFGVFWVHNGTLNALSDLDFDRIGNPTIRLTDSLEELTLVAASARLGFLARKQPQCKFLISSRPKLICLVSVSDGSPEIYAFFRDGSTRWYEEGSDYPANYKEIDVAAIQRETANRLLQRCGEEYQQQITMIFANSYND